MRLDGIGFEVFTFFGNLGGFPNDYCSFIRDRAEIFSFFIKHWLKENEVHVKGPGRLVLFPVSKQADVKEFSIGTVCWRAIEVGQPSDFADLNDDESVYRFLFRMFEKFSKNYEDQTEIKSLSLSEVCTLFADNGYKFDMVLARKILKSLNIEVSTVAKVDCKAITVRLLVRRSKKILHEETISQLNPYPFLLRGAFKKLKAVDRRIWLEEDVPTNVSVAALSNLRHGDWTAKLPRLQFYKWCMEFDG